jgi:hypothetical protein
VQPGGAGWPGALGGWAGQWGQQQPSQPMATLGGGFAMPMPAVQPGPGGQGYMQAFPGAGSSLPAGPGGQLQQQLMLQQALRQQQQQQWGTQ